MTDNSNFPDSTENLASGSEKLDFFADEAALRQLGVDEYAYMRPMNAEAILESFPQIKEQVSNSLLHQKQPFWAMFSAEGLPIALAESAEQLAEMARSTDLEFVTVH
jgi:hypothetical protein